MNPRRVDIRENRGGLNGDEKKPDGIESIFLFKNVPIRSRMKRADNPSPMETNK
jgi:hypothetical protein